jgi:hypothetical protein
MRTKIEYGPGDIRPRSLEMIGIGFAVLAAVTMLLVEAAWFAVAVFVLVLGIAFAIVGAWSEGKVRRGEFRQP